MNLDELSAPAYGIVLLCVVSVCGALAFPLVDCVKRHLAFLATFKAQERRRR